MYFISRLLSRKSGIVASNFPKASYWKGPGSREVQNRLPLGLRLKDLKEHYDLIPLFIVTGVSMVAVVAYIGRLAFLGTDVNWMKRSNPNDYYAKRTFKMIQTSPLEKATKPSLAFEIAEKGYEADEIEVNDDE